LDVTQEKYTPKIPAMKVRIWTSFRINPDDFKELNRAAKRLGITRSEIARRALKVGLMNIVTRKAPSSGVRWGRESVD